MRLILNWIDQLERATVESLPAFCSALVAQFTEIVEAANTWAEQDHNSDGSHNVISLGGTTTAPEPVAGQLRVYWDGTNLVYVKPDGSTGNIV